MKATKPASSARSKAVKPASPVVPPPSVPNLEAVRDALNDIDLRVTRIRTVARTLDEDFYESVANALPKDDDSSEIFLVYCDSLKHAAADIGERTERAFAALAGAANASKAEVAP